MAARVENRGAAVSLTAIDHARASTPPPSVPPVSLGPASVGTTDAAHDDRRGRALRVVEAMTARVVDPALDLDDVVGASVGSSLGCR